MSTFLLYTLLTLTSTFQAQIAIDMLPVGEEIVYTAPSFPAGESALLSFMHEELIYPQLAVEYNVEGTVVARLQLDPEGNIQTVSIVRSLGFGCDKAVIDLINEMPAWQPARYGNQPDYGVVYLPVRFNLR